MSKNNNKTEISVIFKKFRSSIIFTNPVLSYFDNISPQTKAKWIHLVVFYQCLKSAPVYFANIYNMWLKSQS